MNNEKEWRVIPEFPEYEMTFDGEIRTVSHKAEMTFRQVNEDSGMTVTLWRQGGLVDKDIRGLIYEVFPEFQQVSPEARLKLIKRFATEMQHWLGGESFLYAEFEHLAEIVIDEGWRPSE
jgi:hypothetical protein